MMPLFDDRDQHIYREGDPDLSLHGILGSTEKRFNTQVLLDPFEEQFRLPETPVSRITLKAPLDHAVFGLQTG